MRTKVTLGVIALILSLLQGVPASAKAKATPLTLYLHGSTPVGEIEGMQNWSAIPTGGDPVYLPMDPTEPAGPDKSFGIGPLGNAECSGNPVLPTWEAPISGTIKGHMKLTVTLASFPVPLDLRIFADDDELLCAPDMDNPVIEKQITPDPGMTEYEVDLGKVNTSIDHRLILMISPALGAYSGRVFYDSSTYSSRLEFSCVPNAGQASCLTK